MKFRLVARICSTHSTGSHFTTIVRLNDGLIFKVDGMQKPSHAGIMKLLWGYNGRGQSICLNNGQGKKKDSTLIIGCITNIVTIFYVLDMGPVTQFEFFSYQKSALGRAVDLGPIDFNEVIIILQWNYDWLSKANNHVIFGTVSNGIISWIPCTAEEILWRNNASKVVGEFKVSIDYNFILIYRWNDYQLKSL